MYHVYRSFHVTGLLILGFLSGVGSAHAQPAAGGARAAALGNAATALAGSPWAVNNPALPAMLTNRQVELFASRGFNLRALQLASLAYAAPHDWGALSLIAQTLGFSQYRDTRLGLGYAYRFNLDSTTAVSAGVLFLYEYTSITGYGHAGAVGGAVGGFVQISPTLAFGFRASNLHQSVQADRETLPQVLAIGLAYRPVRGSRILIDLVKDIRFPLSVRVGLEFKPIETIVFRTGIATNPRQYTAGIGLYIGPLNGAVAFLHHYALGWTPALSLGINW